MTQTGGQPDGSVPGLYVPAGPEKPDEKVARHWAGVTIGTRSFIGWWAAFLIIGTGLFCWVAGEADAAIAFEVLTQRKTPVDSGLGVAGWALSIFGYFITPAIVGALVSALYVANADMSGRKRAKMEAKIEKAVKGEPGRLRQFWNSLNFRRGAG